MMNDYLLSDCLGQAKIFASVDIEIENGTRLFLLLFSEFSEVAEGFLEISWNASMEEFRTNVSEIRNPFVAHAYIPVSAFPRLP